MIYCFPVPTILDQVDFPKVLINPLPSDALADLTRISESRKKFRALLNEVYLKHQSIGEAFSQYKETIDSYLNQNVDLMRLLGKHKTQPITISWKTFLTRDWDSFTTTKGTNEEALAIELIMARYCYAFAYYTEAEPYINQIRDKFPLTFKENNFVNDEYQKALLQTLDLFYTGWEKLRKLYSVIHLVSKSIVLQDAYLVEAKGNTLDAVKDILEANAGFFYLEYLRLRKDYEKMARVANGNLRRLKQAKSIFEIDAKDLKPEVLEFIEIGIRFYKAYGMWALVTHYERLVAREEYTKKDFVRLTLEMLCMAEQTLVVCEEIKKMKPDKNGNVYRCQQYAEFFEPTCIKITQIYRSVHDRAAKLDGERCLGEIGEEEYLEERFANKLVLSKQLPE